MEATLRVEATHELVACGYIPVRGERATTLPLREYRGNAVRIVWIQNNQRFQSESFVISPPQVIVPNRPVTATVILRDGGRYAASLKQ